MLVIRKATPEDIPFIEKHAYRLLEFGPPSWRDNSVGQMTAADIKHNTKVIQENNPDTEVLIAEDEQGEPLGFLQMTVLNDYYTGERTAHITDIVAIKTAEGKGIGKFLMEQAEEWARKKHSHWITLHVFENNKHARAHYEKAGYKTEWIRYLKELDNQE